MGVFIWSGAGLVAGVCANPSAPSRAVTRISRNIFFIRFSEEPRLAAVRISGWDLIVLPILKSNRTLARSGLPGQSNWSFQAEQLNLNSVRIRLSDPNRSRLVKRARFKPTALRRSASASRYNAGR